jgi:hypothetical protein
VLASRGPDTLKKNFQMRVMFSLGQVIPVASAADSALHALNQVENLFHANNRQQEQKQLCYL